MAGEEDVELRDLVAQTLEAKGVLGKIRAQLRASVFLALEEQESQQRPHPLVNSKLEQFQKTKDGKLVTALVREFLDYFELEYTCSVFDPETNVSDSYPGRERIAKDLNLDLQAASNGPLLAQLVQNALSPPPPPPPSSSSSTSRQLKFPDTISSSHTVSSDPLQLVTSTACSEVGRTAIATGVVSKYTQAPALHSLGPLSENDSERFFTQLQLNDKHLKSPPAAALNSNGNSNTDGDMKSRLATGPVNDLPVPSSFPGLGVGLEGLQSQGVSAELGESFVNSADSSLDVDKLLNASSESERQRELMRPLLGGGEGVNRDELDDFFDSTLPSALKDSKEEDLLRDRARPAMKQKSDELGKEQDSYDDDFHSVELSSQVTEQLEEPSLQLETEDRTFSQSSLSGHVDYIEPIQS